MDMMFEKNKKWDIMCCKERIGACKTCGEKTLAFVSAKTYNNNEALKYSNTNIRMCPLSFTRANKEVMIGMTMLHELVHMSSGAGDKGYTKRECFANARNDPEMARMNSAAYVYFAMEGGFNKKEYEKYSGGLSIMSEGCRDTGHGCFLYAKNGCNSNLAS